MRAKAHLIEIENNRKIDQYTDMKFIFDYKRILLLSLKEAGKLNEMQYRYTEKALREQFLAYVKEKNS